jgi:taurine dioxygenase
VEIKRFDSPIGAEVCGVDLSQKIDSDTFSAIHRALNDYSVIFFRNQNLNEESHIDFSRKFGELEVHVGARYLHPRHPELRINSNIIENGKPIGATDAGQYWHTDLSYMAQPSKCSLLYSLEVPQKNGNSLGATRFVSSIAAYEALPEAIKGKIEGRTAIHSYSYRYYKLTDAGKKRPDLTAEQKAKTPDVEHPIVVTHPITGKKSLFVNEGFTTSIVGMPAEESASLLKILFEHSIRPEFMYEHRWHVGDLLIWDNITTQHFAVADYALPLRRRMHRTTVMGTTLH